MPAHYQAQVLWYLDLLEIDEADVPMLLWPDNKFVTRSLLGMTPAEVVATVGIRVLAMRYTRAVVAPMVARVEAFRREDGQRLVRGAGGDDLVTVPREEARDRRAGH